MSKGGSNERIYHKTIKQTTLRTHVSSFIHVRTVRMLASVRGVVKKIKFQSRIRKCEISIRRPQHVTDRDERRSKKTAGATSEDWMVGYANEESLFVTVLRMDNCELLVIDSWREKRCFVVFRIEPCRDHDPIPNIHYYCHCHFWYFLLLAFASIVLASSFPTSDNISSPCTI